MTRAATAVANGANTDPGEIAIDDPAGRDPEICPLLGRPCPAAVGLARRLAAAVACARSLVGPDFGFDATVRLDFCAAGCAAKAETAGAGIRLCCDSGATVVQDLAGARRLH